MAPGHAGHPLGMLAKRPSLRLTSCHGEQIPILGTRSITWIQIQIRFTDITTRQIPIDGSVQSENKGGISTSYGWPQHNTSEGSVDVLLRLWWQNSAEEYDDEDDHKVRGPKNSQKSVNHWISWGKNITFQVAVSCKPGGGGGTLTDYFFLARVL